MVGISIYEWLEDFDSSELSPSDRKEQLLEAVRTYNEQNDTSHDPEKAYRNYLSWAKDKGYEQ